MALQRLREVSLKAHTSYYFYYFTLTVQTENNVCLVRVIFKNIWMDVSLRTLS